MADYKEFAQHLCAMNKGYCMEVPSMVKTHAFVDHIVHTLFPIKEDCNTDEAVVENALQTASSSLLELMQSIEKYLEASPVDLTSKFMHALPAIYEIMIEDAIAIARFDPASMCVEEVILAYPGFYCIAVYRMAHVLYELKVPLIPRIMMEYVHGHTGIDIHPGARIDSPFFIDHGTGIVIGETAVIGKNVKLYQGVTLGALTVVKEMAQIKRHPTLEDNVIIYAGSTILGGDTVIGHDTIVGGNTWITESILPHSVVYRQHRVVVKDSKELGDVIDFVI